jgi:peptide-methionine (S)-S-oxide reductase
LKPRQRIQVTLLQVTLVKESHGVRPIAKTVNRTMKLETATFGAGCFWCVEAVFLQVEGVHKVVSGYTGGTTVNPTYQAVCMGMTGHAEVIQIQFDPDVISYEELLEFFWHTHDATTLNQQGADVGTQYRSAIFYHTEAQQRIAEKSKAEMDASDMWDAPIVTEITPIDVFYPAEGYHQDYFQLNPNQPYCQFVIHPKMQKFTKDFKDKLKND